MCYLTLKNLKKALRDSCYLWLFYSISFSWEFLFHHILFYYIFSWAEIEHLFPSELGHPYECLAFSQKSHQHSSGQLLVNGWWMAFILWDLSALLNFLLFFSVSFLFFLSSFYSLFWYSLFLSLFLYFSFPSITFLLSTSTKLENLGFSQLHVTIHAQEISIPKDSERLR